MITYAPRRRLHDAITWRMCLSYGMSGVMLATAYVASAPVHL